MNLMEFLTTLDLIHKQGKAIALNHHFLPQQFGCFRDLAPNKWDMVAPISDPSFAQALGKSLGDPHASMPKLHGSGAQATFTISDEENALLKSVTKQEYELLQLVPPEKITY